MSNDQCAKGRHPCHEKNQLAVTLLTEQSEVLPLLQSALQRISRSYYAQPHKTVESIGILKSWGPLFPNIEIRGPRSIHQSNQRLTVFPSPILHLIKLVIFGLSLIIQFIEDEKVAEVDAFQ